MSSKCWTVSFSVTLAPTLSQFLPVGLSTSFWGSMMTTAVSLLLYLMICTVGGVCAAFRCPSFVGESEMDLDLDFSAVDEEFGASHETALVGCEEHYGGGDFVGTANSAHRDGGSHVGEQLLLLARGCEAD